MDLAGRFATERAGERVTCGRPKNGPPRSNRRERGTDPTGCSGRQPGPSPMIRPMSEPLRYPTESAGGARGWEVG
jgi:hypothetical protein